MKFERGVRSPGLPWRMATMSVGSALGAVEFLSKPVDFDVLKAQLRQLPSAME
jgi:hypothetical protein